MYYTLVGPQMFFGGAPDPVDGTEYRLAYYGEIRFSPTPQTSWIYTSIPALPVRRDDARRPARRRRGAVGRQL